MVTRRLNHINMQNIPIKDYSKNQSQIAQEPQNIFNQKRYTSVSQEGIRKQETSFENGGVYYSSQVHANQGHVEHQERARQSISVGSVSNMNDSILQNTALEMITPEKEKIYMQDSKRLSNPRQYVGKQAKIFDRVRSDLNLYKQVQRESYGLFSKESNRTLTSGAGTRNDSRLNPNRSNKLAPMPEQKSQSLTVTKVRHPQLKHKLKGSALTHQEKQMHAFAKNAPLFKQKALSAAELEMLEKIGNMTKTTQSDEEALEKSPKTTQRVKDVEPISDIKDKPAFERSVEMKLNDILKPENIQIFSLEKSKKLYEIANKEVNKVKTRQETWDRKSQKLNRYNPNGPSASQTIDVSALSNNSNENFSGVMQKKRRSLKGLKVAVSRDASLLSLSMSQQGEESSPNHIKPTVLSSYRQQDPANRRERPTTSETQKAIKAAEKAKKAAEKRRLTSRPDYYSQKGRIDIEYLKGKLERDIIHNMNTADKKGVFSALQDIHYDAEMKMIWRQRLIKERNDLKITQKLHEDSAGMQYVDEEFPGYYKFLSEIQHKLAQDRLRAQQLLEKNSPEKIGKRSEFNFGENSKFITRPSNKVDMSHIFDEFQRTGLKFLDHEMFNALVVRSEIIAFMQEIRKDQVNLSLEGKVTDQERDLVNYIKYLIGESRNKEFDFKREDFAQKHELNKKTLKLPFDEYAAQEENSMKTVANDIIERVDYNAIVAESDEPLAYYKHHQNPKFAYYQVCKKDSDLAIPLLAKVVNRQLSLMNYQLSIGHMRAFVRTFDFNKDFVSRFLFKSCGLTDAHLEVLLTAAEKLERVSSLVLKKEEFGSRSVRAIRGLIERPKPFSLQVLRLVDCRVPSQVTRELISIIRQANQIKVLGLVNAKIGHESMQDLSAIVAESRSLTELDISWNVLEPRCYNDLIASLGANKTLLALNLSWNRIVDPTEIFPEDEPGRRGNGNLSNRSKAKPKQNAGNASAQATPRQTRTSWLSAEPAPWHEKEAVFSDLSQKVVENLKHLIKRNKRLQHVNLSGTGLTEYMMLHIGTAMRRAKSLLSIHLCNNPGATDRVRDFLFTRIRCMPERTNIKFPAGEIIAELTHNSAKNMLLRQLNTGQEVEGDKPIARETIKIKQNMERKRIHSLVNDFGQQNDTGNRMIFTRILGHKKDMPGSGQWKLIKDFEEECWICDQEIYGLTFWDSKQIEKKAFMSTKRPLQEPVLRSVIKNLHMITSKEEEDRMANENPRVPIIMGDFTNWKPRPFFEVTDYSEQLVEQYDVDSIIAQMQFDKVLSYRKSEFKNLTQSDFFNWKRYQAMFYEQHVAQDWKQVIKTDLLYKQPHMVNGGNTRPDFYKSLFIVASMFKVGKHEFIIRAPEQVLNRETFEYEAAQQGDNPLPQYSYYNNVSDIRGENVHPFVKESNKNQNVRQFCKEKSVFAPWKEDTPATILKAFHIDWENTRIAKLIKDPSDLMNTRDWLEANYAFIKELYIELQYNSVYPFVNKLETGLFCDKAQLLDDRLKTATCDLLFVSSNTNSREGVKSKSGLIRCEFLEYLVRLANFKYIQTQQAPTFCDAVRILIEDFVKPNIALLPWQSFRDNELWTIEVNDVLETNLDGLTKLHKHYFTPIQNYMSDKDAIKLLSEDVYAEMTYQQAKFCHSYAKMPIQNEIADFDKYSKVQFVEFLEMIGRAAKVKYTMPLGGDPSDDEPLARKIEMILDLLFPLVKFQRREVSIDNESESASDDDY